jgi:hypothetical protein
MEGPLTIGSSTQVEALVVRAAMVVAAQGKSVVEVGGPARTPGKPVVVDLAPGEGAPATGHGSPVVDQ